MQRIRWAILLATCWVVACSTPPPAPEPSPPSTTAFSAERAWNHLEAIVGFGARTPGSEGSKAARAYIRSHLDSLNIPLFELPLSVNRDEEQEPLELVHLTGVIEGEASGILVLAAPYDTPQFEGLEFVGANDGASGAALLLEIARGLSEEPLPYTVWLTFIDGDAAPAGGGPQDGGQGSRLWVDQLAERGVLSSLRLVFYFNRVADADLRIGRDLLSHRISRSRIFTTARRLGHGGVFPRGLALDRVPGGHTAFIRRGMRRAVVIGDPVHGGEEAPGLFWHTQEDNIENCSAASLGIVGDVTRDALVDISAMLQKVDRFGRRRGADEATPLPVAERLETIDEATPSPDAESVEAEDDAASSPSAELVEAGEESAVAAPSDDNEDSAPATDAAAEEPESTAPDTE